MRRAHFGLTSILSGVSLLAHADTVGYQALEYNPHAAVRSIVNGSPTLKYTAGGNIQQSFKIRLWVTRSGQPVRFPSGPASFSISTLAGKYSTSLVAIDPPTVLFGGYARQPVTDNAPPCGPFVEVTVTFRMPSDVAKWTEDARFRIRIASSTIPNLLPGAGVVVWLAKPPPPKPPRGRCEQYQPAGVKLTCNIGTDRSQSIPRQEFKVFTDAGMVRGTDPSGFCLGVGLITGIALPDAMIRIQDFHPDFQIQSIGAFRTNSDTHVSNEPIPDSYQPLTFGPVSLQRNDWFLIYLRFKYRNPFVRDGDLPRTYRFSVTVTSLNQTYAASDLLYGVNVPICNGREWCHKAGDDEKPGEAGRSLVRGNNGLGNGEDPQPPGDPKTNDGAGTRPGRPGNRNGGSSNGSNTRSGNGSTGGNGGGSSSNRGNSGNNNRNITRGNNGVGNGTDPQPRGNPPVNDGAGTGPGNPGNKRGAKK